MSTRSDAIEDDCRRGWWEAACTFFRERFRWKAARDQQQAVDRLIQSLPEGVTKVSYSGSGVSIEMERRNPDPDRVFVPADPERMSAIVVREIAYLECVPAARFSELAG